MVMTAPPWIAAVRAVTAESSEQPYRRIMLSPQGRRLDEALAVELASSPRLLLLCGRYEGIDERVRRLVVDEEISIGDYVLSGGELPAMVLIEAVSRKIPGVVGLADSVANDSFRTGLLDFPHYTRPPEVEGERVPDVLLSGDHARIAAWRRKEALQATVEKRPDLLSQAPLDDRDRQMLSELAAQRGTQGVIEPVGCDQACNQSGRNE
jgi:tRNA (guanine37-N1)-methyltransferase